MRVAFHCSVCFLANISAGFRCRLDGRRTSARYAFRNNEYLPASIAILFPRRAQLTIGGILRQYFSPDRMSDCNYLLKSDGVKWYQNCREPVITGQTSHLEAKTKMPLSSSL